MKSEKHKTHIIELDGEVYHLQHGRAVSVKDAAAVKGDKWLLTDFQEGMSRVMTVEGPAKYADVLVRRKLQESGEFEEAVQIVTHWRRKRGKHATDIFFTAIPSRLAGFYTDTLRRQDHVTLTVPVYALLWSTVKRLRSRKPVAVVLRHDRFAEVLVAGRDRVYFANRTVAFDTHEDQIKALWETVRSDMAAVESEHRLEIEKVMVYNWLGADERPEWPEDWDCRLRISASVPLSIGDQVYGTNLPDALDRLSTSDSASPPMDMFFCYARRWAPVLNLAMLAVLLVMAAGMMFYRQQHRHMVEQVAGVGRDIRQVRLDMPRKDSQKDFAGMLAFIEKVDRNRRLPDYGRIINDLHQAAFDGLKLQQLKIGYEAGQVVVDVVADIQAPFSDAHDGYQRFVRRLRQYGYVIGDHRFETQISKSQLVLTLRREMA